MQLLPYFASFLTRFTLDKVRIHWPNMLEIDTNQKFKGSAVNCVLSILEVKRFFHILEFWNTPNVCQRRSAGTIAEALKIWGAMCFNSQKISFITHILWAESEKNANISGCSALYIQREEGRSTRAMGKQQMATRLLWLIWWVYKHRLSVHAKMIGGDFYDSMEIVLSSLTFMHSQTQSQPWLKVVYQQFLLLNLNHICHMATFILC